MGPMDGAYKWCRHMAWPFIYLTDQQKECNNVHDFCRACVEHLFACMWHWGIIMNIWRRSGTELHEHVCVLLHLQKFLI